MWTDPQIRELRTALREARMAQRGAFRAWQIAQEAIQDDLSPPDRMRRQQAMRSSKRLCLRAARQVAAIEVYILSLKMQ